MKKFKRFSFNLKNGIRFVGASVEDSPALSISIWIHAGSRWEDSKSKGYSHFIEHLLFSGTNKFSSFDIVHQVEKKGASINAATSRDYIVLNITIVKTELEFAFSILADMLFNSGFSSKEVTKEKKVILEEIHSYKDSPEDFIGDKFLELILNKHSLGINILGTKKSIRDASRDDLFSYYKSIIRAKDITICAVGNIEKKKFRKTINRFYEQDKKIVKNNSFFLEDSKVLKLKNLNKQNKKNSPHFHSVRKHYNRKLEQLYFYLGFQGLNMHTSLWEAMMLFDIIFAAGMASVLFQSLREKKGLCYNIESYFYTFDDFGAYSVNCGTSPEKFKDAVNEILIQFEIIENKKIIAKYIDDAKSNLSGRFQLGLETVDSLMMDIARQDLYEKKYRSIKKRIEKVNRVSENDILKVIKVIKSKKPALISLGKLNKGLSEWHPDWK